MPSPHAVAELLRLANRTKPKSEEGQDLVEYALLVALIVLVALSAVQAVGQTIYNVFWKLIEGMFA